MCTPGEIVGDFDPSIEVGETVGPNDGPNVTIRVGDGEDMTEGVWFIEGEGVIGQFVPSIGVPVGVLLVDGFGSSGELGGPITLGRTVSVVGSGAVVTGAIEVVIGEPVPPGGCKREVNVGCTSETILAVVESGL